MHFHSLDQLADGLSSKAFSSVELTQHFLQRIKSANPTLNAFITINEVEALKAAHAADAIRQSGNAGPLTGIPLAHKDIFCTTDIKTTCASKMLDSFIAPYDATVVERCRKAGMIVLGKTNMDEFAMGSSNETSYYGPCLNPWDHSCVPGGSSGGSASAVAAGLAPISTGTDTGGSIRQPAAFCGLTGLKPTYGQISRWGIIAFASSLDQAGPLARSAKDAALLMDVMSGWDAKDSTSTKKEPESFTTNIDQNIKGLRIGVVDNIDMNALTPAVAASFQETLNQFKKLGAEISSIKLPHLDYSVPVYYVIAPAECSSNLSRYDGVRFGHRCDNPKDLKDLYVRSRSEGFGAEVKRRIMMGTHTLSHGFFDAYYLKAGKIRRLIRQDFLDAFKKVDIILTPTTPSCAFKFGAKKDPVSMYLSDIFTIAANLAGIPAISFPTGMDQHLPIGMQCIGPAFGDAQLLQVVHAFQKATDWHTHTPKNWR